MILNLALGSGLVVTLSTLRAIRKEAGAKAQRAIAEARTNELQNVEAAIRIWRETAQDMSDKYESVSTQVDLLRKEVKRLNTINNKILKLLDKINPENLENIVELIKKTLTHEE
ncbi:hypothetical protein [Alkaliflexus imshenetskii]|uniref:hypothetical protein n=1 Tax=Alkaliflexus imshenetskii TaxID=286730 RepID=UPI0012F9211A|nr:hypothetical protein [Alkaliflexus imshenetskii]